LFVYGKLELDWLGFSMGKRFSKTALACVLVALSFTSGMFYMFFPGIRIDVLAIDGAILEPPRQLLAGVFRYAFRQVKETVYNDYSDSETGSQSKSQ
jgi:hypothetical protein